MNPFKYILASLILVVGLTACSSSRVVTDYDKNVDFDNYETFGFYKPGIDSVSISDLDKRRIIKAIDTALSAKGMTKSKEPDLLISFFTESAENINVRQNYYGGWGWYDPWYWGPAPYGPYGYYNRAYTSRNTEGTLYIDLIDGEKRMLIWQGVSTGTLKPDGSVDEKTENINKIVQRILDEYPPNPDDE